MFARIVVKLLSHPAGSAEMFIPKILVSSHREKPRFLTPSGTWILLPIGRMAVFSMLHFNPLKVANSIKMDFRAVRLSKQKRVATLVSSAKPSALSVSHLDSFKKQGLFLLLTASKTAGCEPTILPNAVRGTWRWW